MQTTVCNYLSAIYCAISFEAIVSAMQALQRTARSLLGERAVLYSEQTFYYIFILLPSMYPAGALACLTSICPIPSL
jgi:hypothetical protein